MLQRFLLAVALTGCSLLNYSFAQTKKVAPAITQGHPSWIMQGNIYEVNIRQYTPEGNFKAFEKHLPRLKQMGVQTLWFMPINPISVKDRKGSLGSYYAISNYTAVNPEYGTLADWKALVAKAHSMGFKVIIDWVANHTGADNYWLDKHPDFFERDSAGKFIAPFDWTDVRKLDYKNTAMADSMINSMLYWVKQSDIDGFRCDVAGEVPDAFWKKCISTLRKHKYVFMLAEGDKPSLHEAGFDATYAWSDFAMLKQMASGQRKAFAIDSVLTKNNSTFTANALRMYFTSNHDENTWNKADYETMPGVVHAPFAVLTQTIGRSVPLIYSGQEEPLLRAIRFFDKDTISFSQYKRAAFYKTLLNLRSTNPALSADASFTKVKAGNEDAVYAYTRSKNGKKILVILNLSNKPQPVQVTDKSLHGNPYNVFMGTQEPLKDELWEIQPWGYVVYTY
jgi:glycosidase